MFKVGDLVKGTDSNGKYGITNEFMTEAEVLDVWPEEGVMEIMVTKHEFADGDPDILGGVWEVDMNYFDLVASTPKVTKNIASSGVAARQIATNSYEALVALGEL